MNLTPHTLVVMGARGQSPAGAPDGPPARIEELRDAPDLVDTDLGLLPVVPVRYADRIVNLPEPVPGVRFVVSRVTAAASTNRADLLFPLDEVRDARGVIVGCRALGRFGTATPPQDDDRAAGPGGPATDAPEHRGGS